MDENKKASMFIRKYLLMTAILFFANPVFSAKGENPKFNAVCVTLKSGDCKYAAFTDRPQITAKGGKLYVLSSENNKQLILANCSDVEKITAEYYNFNSTSIKEPIVVDGKNIEGIYNIDGTKATHIIPGRIYIIKSKGQTRKIIK